MTTPGEPGRTAPRSTAQTPPRPPPVPPRPPPATAPAPTADAIAEPLLEYAVPINVNFWAIAAGYLGLFSLLGVPGPFALATGIVALVQLRKTPHVRGHVRAWIGIVLGALGTVGLLLSIVAWSFDAP